MIKRSQEKAGRTAALAGNSFKSPKIRPIENTRRALTPREQHCRQENSRPMIETMNQVTAVAP